MKVLTILGTRPEIIRLSLIIPRLDQFCQHVLVHTGQNYDPRLNDIFFKELGLRTPDRFWGVRGNTFSEQIGGILAESEKAIQAERPDRVLILGDTNSGLAAVVAKRMGVPVYHLEAGNRCFDDRVPEEINRRIIDHCSDVLMPYTERSRQNLLREGIPGERTYVIGNPIYEVIQHYDSQIGRSTILAELGLQAGRYFLVTVHRAENVDIEDRLQELMTALNLLQHEYQVPMIVSTHPRTRERMEEFGMELQSGLIRFMPPFGFFEFISLERQALCVLSDSGTVQEESAIFGVPNVTIRDVTERPETIECGSNMLSGTKPETILRCVRSVLALENKWSPPREYVASNVSQAVIKIVLGFRS
jgi:UDP-N-acetylglucosamine 2-epimerase (non-hydrolysing)